MSDCADTENHRIISAALFFKENLPDYSRYIDSEPTRLHMTLNGRFTLFAYLHLLKVTSY